MEPIKINIELTASDSLKELVRTLAETLSGIQVHPTSTASIGEEASKAGKQEDIPAVLESKQAAAAVPAEPQPASAPRDVTQSELFDCVADIKNKVGKGAVKALFAEFGIQYSRECPAERRWELVDRLNALSHA